MNVILITVIFVLTGLYKFATHVFPTHSLVRSALDQCWSTVYDTGPALGQRGVNESFHRDLFSYCLCNSTYQACPANMLRWPVLVLVQGQRPWPNIGPVLVSTGVKWYTGSSV